MRVLISWYAFNNDFVGSEANVKGPTYQFHQHFFDHDQHLILSSEKEDDTRLNVLMNRLALDFPHHRDRINHRYMDINDVIDMSTIKQKIEALLLSMSDHELDLFISPGTPAMQVAWYLCHSTLHLKTRLLQTRPPSKTKSGQPELVVTQAEESSMPVSMVIREELHQSTHAEEADHLILPSIQPVYDRAYKLAQTDRVTGLILGASGTGKEHLANYIHDHSSRRTRKFISVNCSALGDTLLESRLFGYERGAFTGADKRTDGYFDAAKGGTLFLDEIGDISPYMQQSLLRVLQTGGYMPVGSTTERKADVRIVAATHRLLRQECEAGKFRWDLFYRLAVAELHLPSLVERGAAEKRTLIEYFLTKKQSSFRRAKPLKLTAAAWRILDAYLFPGNIRELENLIESLYVFSGETADVADLPDWIRLPSSSTASFSWQEHEKALIQRALTYHSGNKARACAALGYGSINTLAKKIVDYQIGSTPEQ
ncbi:hypothetical protein GCM10023187_27190 [Nibrella viscosa]|uniref:Sigma-54 factor interaction domain-containing protein n=1 Tax=Nibrella viscosa TaxID=1084524 RepID=A0ABP8KI02_9BACT